GDVTARRRAADREQRLADRGLRSRSSRDLREIARERLAGTSGLDLSERARGFSGDGRRGSRIREERVEPGNGRRVTQLSDGEDRRRGEGGVRVEWLRAEKGHAALVEDVRDGEHRAPADLGMLGLERAPELERVEATNVFEQ